MNLFSSFTRGMSAGTAALCLSAITHTYLLFHCYPYIGYMSVALVSAQKDVDVSVNDAGLYAGLLGTAFTTGRCLGFVPWKVARHSNKYGGGGGGGVKRTLLWSLWLSAVCSIWFGTSSTFRSAWIARFCLGLSNSISGCVKRGAIDRERTAIRTSMVAAAAQKKKKTEKQQQQQQQQEENNEKYNDNSDDKEQKILRMQQMEEMAPSRVLAVMHGGSVIGPLLGGLLSNAGVYSQDTLLPNVIDEQYPFLLPNAVAAFLCLVSMGAVAIFFTDSNTKNNSNDNHNNNDNDNDNDNETNNNATDSSVLRTNDTDQVASSSLDETQSLLHNHTTCRHRASSSSTTATTTLETLRNFWKSTSTRWHLLAYFAFSFVVVCVDEALPLFLIARSSGPGLAPREIGYILATSALLVVISQSVVKTERILAEEEDGLGFYPTLRLASVMGNIPSVLIPIMLVFNGGIYHYYNNDWSTLTSAPSLSLSQSTTQQQQERDDDDSPLGSPGTLTWSAFLFLAILIGCLRAFASVYFSLIGIATGRTVPPCHRDEVARIMTHGALYARAVAPVVAGILVSMFLSESSWIHTKANTTNTTTSTIYYYAATVALWSFIGLFLGFLAAAFTFQLRDNAADGKDSARSRSNRHSLYLNKRQRAQVFVKLWDVHYDKGSSTAGSKWRRVARKVIAYNRISGDKVKKEEKHDDVPSQPRPRHRRRTTWTDHSLQPGIDIENTDFFILGTSKLDKACMPHVLTPPLMKSLHQNLTGSAKGNFWLKYSLVRDGGSFQTLESKIYLSKNTIIAIETLEGDVFGCFMAKPWKRTNRYERCGVSFLWRMMHKRNAFLLTADQSGLLDEDMLDEIAKKESDIEIFPWTGANEDCQLFCHDRLAAGGGIVLDSGQDGFGFILEDDLSKGSSSPCETYGNPCLVSSSSNGRFEVANMEVWCMTAFLFVVEAEKSESTLRLLQDNTSSSQSVLGGDAPSSAQSAWTNFL